MWFEHHLKKSFIPNARASLMDVQGMLRIIECGLGAGVLPLHVISRHNKLKNNLYVFDGGLSLSSTLYQWRTWMGELFQVLLVIVEILFSKNYR